MQINPGCIGGKTKSEILSKYRSERNRDLALMKLVVTKSLQGVQRRFVDCPSVRTWDFLCNAYFGVMRETWGWPPGGYARTIEAHGVGLDSIAVVNLALCPVPNDNYSKGLLKKCWNEQTYELLSILQPGIIVAQSKTVFEHLKTIFNTKGAVTVLQGVHHASRASSNEKQRLFKTVCSRLMKA
jgi:hypothetical protein